MLPTHGSEMRLGGLLKISKEDRKFRVGREVGNDGRWGRPGNGGEVEVDLEMDRRWRWTWKWVGRGIVVGFCKTRMLMEKWIRSTVHEVSDGK